MHELGVDSSKLGNMGICRNEIIEIQLRFMTFTSPFCVQT